MSENELKTVSVEPRGVVVRLTAAEAHIPVADMEPLYAKHGVETSEIRRGTPKDAFKRACREFETDFNSRYKSRGLRLIKDNVGVTDDNEQIFLFRRGRIDKSETDSDYSEAVAKVYLKADRAKDGTYHGGTVIAMVDHEGVTEALQRWFDHEWSHYRLDQWRHVNRRNLERLRGATMLPNGGLYWVPLHYEDGSPVETNVNGTTIANERALTNMQVLFRDISGYQSCACRSTGALSTREPSAMVLRYGDGDEATDMHRAVLEATVSKAELIAAESGLEVRELIGRAENGRAINVRSVLKLDTATAKVTAMVAEVQATIGGDLARAEQALRTIERARVNLTKARNTNGDNNTKGNKK